MRVTKVDVTIPSSGYYLGYVSLVLDNAYTLNGVRITCLLYTSDAADD